MAAGIKGGGGLLIFFGAQRAALEGGVDVSEAPSYAFLEKALDNPMSNCYLADLTRSGPVGA